jgi:small-conductance mechanosensitive channel
MTFESWLFDPTLGKIVAVLVGILIIRVVWGSVQHFWAPHLPDGNARYQMRKVTTFAAYLVGVVLVTLIYRDQLGSLTVAFGVAGAGIAFALQEVIVSLAGWAANAFGSFYRVGDRVQLGGIKGDVIDIGILRTTLMECGEWIKGDLYTGRIVRIANSFVFKEPVFNYSADFPYLWDEIIIPVKYGSDIELARQILQTVTLEVVGEFINQASTDWQRMLQKYMVEKTPIEPMVTLLLNDNWVEFTVRYAVYYKQRRGTKDRLYSRLLEEIDKSQGKVTIASTTLQLVNPPKFDIRMAGDKE